MQKKKNYIKNVILFGITLLIFLIITNPTILFFLPKSTKNDLSNTWGDVFGDVNKVSSLVKLNWITIFQVITVILLMIVIINIIRFILSLVKPKTGKGKSIHSMVGSFTTYTGALISLIWCLSIIGINLSTIFASIGLIALIIGFAAESLIADIITGIFLVFEDEFNVGDIIEIDDFRGQVISIGIRVTCIQDNGGNIKVINNSNVKNILNRSKAQSCAVCDVPVSYEANLTDVEKVLADILNQLPAKYPTIFPTIPVYIGLQELSASSVNLRVVASVLEANIYNAQRILNREVKLGFDAAHVEIPYQQVVVHQAK